VPEAEIDFTGVEEEELKVAQQTFTAKMPIPVLLSGQNTMLLHFLTFRWLHQSYDQIALAGQATVRNIFAASNTVLFLFSDSHRGGSLHSCFSPACTAI
jgi:hypothetical protein